MQFFLHLYGDSYCGPEWRVPVECPFFNRLYYVVSGHAEYESAVEHFVLEPGRFYLFPQNVEYSIEHDLQRPLHTVFFHLTCVPNTAVPIDCTPERPEDRELLEVLIRHVDTFEHEVLASLLSAYLTRTAAPKFAERSDHSMDRVLSYIHSHCFAPAEELTSAKLAQIACYNECYLIRKFKSVTGLSPKQYIIDLKLKCAIPLLSQMPLSEVSQQIGFADYNNFRKRFKEKYGVNPSGYAAAFPPEI